MYLTGHKLEKLISIRKIQNKMRLEKQKVLNKEKRLNRNRQSAFKCSENQKNLNNPNEKKFKNLLIELGIYFEWQKPFYDYQRYVSVDFFIPEINTVIEIDGLYHDLHKDTQRTLYLKKIHNVKKVLRFTNQQIALSFDYVKNKLINQFII